MQIRVRSGPRRVRFAPPLDGLDGQREQDDALGLCVWRMLAEALGRGVPPPAVLLLTGSLAHLVDIVPLLNAGAPLDGNGVAGFASLPEVEVMALVGVLNRRQRGRDAARWAVAFLEWPDGRWWLARRALTGSPPESPLRLDPLAEVTVERAVDGVGKPGGIGGWFRRARVEHLQARLDPVEVEN